MLKTMVRTKIAFQSMKENVRQLKKNQKGEGMVGWIIAICIGIVIAAFVALPGGRAFAGTVFAALNSWWNNSVDTAIFPTT